MAKNFLTFKQDIKDRDQINLARDLSILLKTGVTLNEAVSMIRDQARSRPIRNLMDEVFKSVERGSNLSSAIDKSQYRLKNVFVSMVKAGEVSGSLSKNLLFVSIWLESNLELKKNIRSVTLYPKIVITAAFLLGMLLSIYILPKLIPIFTGMHMELPLVTRIVLGTATFFKERALLVILGVFIVLIVYNILSTVKVTRRLLQTFYMKIPFFGNLIKSYELALYSQLMAVLLKSGLTINESFEVAGSESKNIPYQNSFQNIRQRLMQGVSLSESIKEYPKLYPNNYSSIILVGEKTGTLNESFSSLAEYYNRDIKIRTRDLPTIIEPILLVLIGVIVTIIALSIILPIYTLSSNLN